MTTNAPAQSVIDTLVTHRKWLLAPTLICTLLALCYVLFAEKSYTSRQSLIVRDDLVGSSFKPGKFNSLDSLKSIQETILEVARRPHVIRTALEQLGPSGFTSESAWLGEQNIEVMQGRVQISAPNGAEFGSTETIVLSVQQNSRERAGKYIVYLLEEIEQNLQKVRGLQFASMQKELEQSAEVAEGSYFESANQLRSFEQNIGSDLITLLSLNDAQQGTNVLQSELGSLNVEQRQAWSEMESVKKQIQILGEVAHSPDSILEVPQELLELQPTLASLARGLNEAILAYSKSQGRYQPQHPRVREDKREVADIRQRVSAKLSRTIGSLQSQLELRVGKYDRITQIINQKRQRLSELSSLRVDYNTLRKQVDKKREMNAKAQSTLAEISSLGESARHVSLISKIHEPQTELYADGLSSKAILFGSMIAGLLIGLGLVMFVAPTDDGTGVENGGYNPSRSDQGNLRPTKTREFGLGAASESLPPRSQPATATTAAAQQSAPTGGSIPVTNEQQRPAPTATTPAPTTFASSAPTPSSPSPVQQANVATPAPLSAEPERFSSPAPAAPQPTGNDFSQPIGSPSTGAANNPSSFESSNISDSKPRKHDELSEDFGSMSAAELAASITGSIAGASAAAGLASTVTENEIFETEDVPMESTGNISSLIDDPAQTTGPAAGECKVPLVSAPPNEGSTSGSKFRAFDSDLEEDPLARLRSSYDSSTNLPEKLNQLDQQEFAADHSGPQRIVRLKIMMSTKLLVVWATQIRLIRTPKAR